MMLPISALAENCTETKLEKMIETGDEEATIAYIKSGKAPINKLGCSRPLIRAIAHLKLNIFKALITAGADVNLRGYYDSKYYYNRPPLYFAADKEDSSYLKLLIEAKAKLDEQMEDGKTALIGAVKYGTYENVKLLIEAGADKDIQTKLGGNTALLEAIEYCSPKQFKMAKLLIQSGANAFRKNKSDVTSLMMASHCGDVELVSLLLEKTKLIVNSVDSWGNTALSGTKSVEVASLLLGAGANPNKGLPLFKAIEDENAEMVALLLDNGALADLANDKKETPLMIAAKKGNVDMSKMLIASGANPNSMDNQNKTPLFLAVEERNFEMAKMLLVAGADIQVGNSKYAILSAVGRNNAQMVELLIQAGANLEVRDPFFRTGETPLIASVKLLYNANEERVQIVKALITAGVNVNAKDDRGMTALAHVRKYRQEVPEVQKEIERILVAAGATE